MSLSSRQFRRYNPKLSKNAYTLMPRMLRPRHTSDTLREAGIDEAGRGCLWGPLIAAAVIWPAEDTWTEAIRTTAAGIKDSKKLSAKRRSAMETFIKETATAYSIGRVEAAEIDQIGMTAANRLAFTRAVEGLAVPPERLLIDGILALPGVDIPQIVEAEADGRYLVVAAASILAKEEHDRIVGDACSAEPTLQDRYAILNCKGYGTTKHRDGVKTHGMHSQHRRLFLRKILGIEHVIDKTALEKTGYDFID
jgi:ribonuclease HII